jgi:hypothetical protein
MGITWLQFTLVSVRVWKRAVNMACNLQPANSFKCTQLTPKTASLVPPEDGRLTPETYRGLRHNKVFVTVKVKVYQVGYVTVMVQTLCFP